MRRSQQEILAAQCALIIYMSDFINNEPLQEYALQDLRQMTTHCNPARFSEEWYSLAQELSEARRELAEAQQSSFYGRLAARMMKERNKLRQKLLDADTKIYVLETGMAEIRRTTALEITTELAKKVGGLQSPMIRMFRKWIAATYLEDGPARPETVEEPQQ